MFLTLCASLADCDGWTNVERFGNANIDWLRKYLPFELGVPSHDTLGRVFSRLDPVHFYACLKSFANEVAGELAGRTTAIDGKTLRGSHEKASGRSALHSVTAWVSSMKHCIGMKSVEDKSNEIPAVRELIGMLDLKGAIVTADAMHCQKETAEKIQLKDADYILYAKDNQPTLKEEIDKHLLAAMEQDDDKLRRHRTREVNRGREEFRETVVLPVPKQNAVFQEWEGIGSIGLIHRTVKSGEKTSEEISWFITSLPARVKDISKRLREHWGIENAQYYVLDVTFNEDSSRIRQGAGPEISSAFRRLSLNILQRDTSIKDNIRGKRKRCSFSHDAIKSIFQSFRMF